MSKIAMLFLTTCFCLQAAAVLVMAGMILNLRVMETFGTLGSHTIPASYLNGRVDPSIVCRCFNRQCRPTYRRRFVCILPPASR
ncbi:hypothetical protein BV22DRAFT_1039772 [Leucogyrophana mollusca]|uniref:Uncharacterized protein n=1 Tax=Leucogyrophana mollusca TaxID=85980 RepID=A0ACB8B6K8_9AGAM|nr:hypothetical protein BV22DRAFT_1039772 [Leucogyrophana mollusca]